MQPGIYRGLSFDEYKAIDAANYSTLKNMDVPAKAKYERDHDKATRAKNLGTAVDCYLLEPGSFQDQYEVPEQGEKMWPNATCPVCGAEPLKPCQKKGGGDRANCCAGRKDLHDSGSKHVLSGLDWIATREIVAAVRSHRQARTLLDITEHQVSLVWNDAATGLLCKARLDMVRPGTFLADLKTCRGGAASSLRWPKHAWDLGYAVQVALYHDGWLTLTGEDLPWFWLCSETTAPYLVAVHRAAEAWVTRGRDVYRRALVTYAECLASGVWPGYYCDDDPAPVSPPMWLPKIDNGEEEEFDE